MDNLTHGLLGAAAAHLMVRKRIGKKALVAGALAATLPDLDVLIHSASDPMMGVALHRHFTHALIFIPVGALLVFLFLQLFRSYRVDKGALYGACFWGYATHALLDTCTSYGTMLLWPFSAARVAWDCIAIVDPIFTAALLIGILLTHFKRNLSWTAVALIFCLAYLGLGEVQNRRAETVQKELAQSRGQIWTKGRVMPTLGNLVVWRSIYEADGRLWADALRVIPWGGIQAMEGASVTVFRSEMLAPEFLENPSLRRDWETFFWFSEGYVALDGDANTVADMRYSSETSGFKPLWGILLPEDPKAPHVGWKYFKTNRRDAVKKLWKRLTSF